MLACDKLMTHFAVTVAAFLLLHCIGLSPLSPLTLRTVEATPEDEAVGKWAIQFGDELWELAQRMTKSQEIKAKYKEYNARVELKNGTELIQSITANVGRMLSRKMDAVRCIQQKAESVYEDFQFNRTLAEKEFQYYSSKFSMFDGKRAEELLSNVEENEWMYLNMTLNPDTHFYNISVDTQHSSVHVPSNVYDRSPEVLKTIMWSETLDEVFTQNYQSDPALSWQYFGSDTGILRHYPASQWQEHDDDDNADTYDCRKRSWYIETATCSKDIVILLDNSGSMTGFRNHVAKFTIRSILDTFSNNDFFTIFNYSATVDDIIPCFKDALVQATPENINVFNDAIEKIVPEGYANLTIAYEKAFQLLKKYYVERHCNETSTCNQAIMLVTDGVAGNTTDVFEKYNWGNGENGTSNMRVRIFTYLLGKEVTKVREIQWMACLNRGFYSHVQTLDEVHEEVLKYVDVIATPLVLQNEEHPPTWTHSFTDKTYKQKGNTTETRLMIAVGVPAFDRSYRNENSTKRARLLGVAGTDVPVEDIDKLTLPYKLGVNGYSFVVSNNGYVLLHPDLRPIANVGRMNPNYNSIDFTEVEHLYEDDEPRQPGDSILQLRSAMVRHQTGEFKDISVKFHYDKMRRVSEEKQEYFFAPLPNTPFSLGIVLPSEYGKTWIKVGEEVLKNKHMKVNISEYFVGENWKVHPDWVYCKYHYLEGHEFKTPEDELRHFLRKMFEKNWKWSEQYTEDESDHDDIDDVNCGRKTQDDDAYYCNKELVHLLIFDAKVTNSSYGEWKFASNEERHLIESFGATLRFVATMSGLTRWQFIYGEVEVENDQEFGDYHTTAIDETWYKSAILQHHQERTESFVYSVKHASDPAEDAELKVTASHAIFPRDGGKEAPACVVGFQFSHALMLDRFTNITSVDNCHGCIKTCASDEIECYVIDHNAYIILAQNVNHTGKFFGEYQGDVMAAMVEKNFFQSINVYDYQALCPEGPEGSSDAHSLLDPLRWLSLGWRWLVARLFWQWTRIQWWVDGAPFLEYLDEIDDDYEAVPDAFPGQQPKPKEISEDGEVIFQEKEPEPVYNPCDTKSTLYVLQPNSLEDINDFIKVPNSRPFYLKKIPNTNLLLVVVNVLMPSKGVRLSTEPQRVDYDLEFPCYKLNMSFYERRRIEECYTEHPEAALKIQQHWFGFLGAFEYGSQQFDEAGVFGLLQAALHAIQQKAESVYEDFQFNRTLAEKEFQYYSSKFSMFDGKRAEELLSNVEENEWMYLNMTLNPDTHFYNISVDTQHSSVHVPSNVYDRSPEVLKTIMWSETLDEVFTQNYQSDPALSWQYFGSDTGILRHYPASQWQEHDDDDNADTYDCRKRSWYIETATCSKDIVILLDNSGSMTGFRNHVAKFTIRSILDTFSNNDFFTIFNYSATVDDIIPCFKDALVQATPENINVFNDAIEKIVPEGYANLTIAYEKAFQLLKKYYVERHCNETSTCNQAIMLVTDGVAGNTTDVFEKYNWGNGENGTSNMRVRIFTYLLGKEVTKVREIQWMACLNRGFYSHVQTLDEVHEEVLKYVDVIATPLVLQNEEHPPTWTHSFTDKTYKQKGNTTETRLMIAVGVPAFDRSYRNENSTKRARLLGVAGTDVPVEDIDKLTLPYKLGVNGYSFVVSNNGYVLLHPDLRPIANVGRMNPNYNSIDFTEVEHLYEDDEPRQPGDSILQLRSAMVRHQTGEFKDISVKFHYDKMRRVSEEKQEYFFAPLPNTPFSLGIVLPSEYGKTWIKVGEEVLKNKHMKVNISEYFVGENWKVHPDWVYCKYHYLEGHEFKTPEDELRHFLRKMFEKNWKWSEQYTEDESDHDDIDDVNCGRKTQDDDAYYCNKELVHLLIFDAKVTNSSYGEWKFASNEERHLIESFGATLRFVATMSGLTRWQFIYGEVEVENDQEFGDYHTTAIDETWYKSAILQHHQERTESFVYSVKHASDPAEDAELKVTASHAIFPRDGGKEAPACVVGFQFSHALMLDRFTNITSVDNCHGCIKTCASDEIECYVIDHNAYIILAQNVNHTGKFFGEYQGDVMAAMVEKNFFQSINVYDYQALCPEGPEGSSDAHSLLDPLRWLSLGWRWLVARLFWQWTRIQWWVDGAPFLEYLDEIDDDYEAVPDAFPGQQPKPKEISEDGEVIFQEKEPEPVYNPCDTKSTLYVLQPNSLEDINDFIKVPNSRPFYLKKIPNTNLLLVVVNVLMPSKGVRLSTEPQRVDYDLEFPCYKLNMSFYERRRIEECYTEHPEEERYTYCGDATSIRLDIVNLAVTMSIVLLTRYLRT